MNTSILTQHKILPMRTGQEQFSLAGVDTQLMVTDTERGLVYVIGAGAAIMTEDEWQSYILLCDTWLNSPVDADGGDNRLPAPSYFQKAFTEIERMVVRGCESGLIEAERKAIFGAIASKLLPLKEAVLRAEEIWKEDSRPHLVVLASKEEVQDFSTARLTPAGEKGEGGPDAA